MPSLILLFAVIIGFVGSGSKYRHFFYCYAIGLIFSFMALRYGYGNDFFSYLNSYKTFTGNYDDYNKELGFWFLISVSPSFQLIIILSSVLAVHSYHKIFNKYSDRVRTLILMWFILIINPFHFLHNISAIRQAIAIAFCVYAYCYLLKDRKYLFVVLVFIAAQFHSSAVVFYFIAPLFFIIRDDRRWLNKTVHCIFLLLVLYFDFTVIASILILGGPLQDYYFYLGESVSGANRTLYLNASLAFALIVSDCGDKKFVLVKFLALIGLYIGVIGVQIPIVHRVGLYFEIFVPIALVGIILKPSLKNKLVFFYFTLVYFLRFVNFNFMDELWLPFRNYQIFFFANL